MNERIGPFGMWQPMHVAPKEGGPYLGWVKDRVRLIQWGKTSHIPLWGWCLADQGAEDFDICEPACWMELPASPMKG